jgi:deferrochelatase/peroxidase EfeB
MTRKPEALEKVAARMAKMRDRKRESGQVEIRVWVPANREQAVRDAIQQALKASA